jgi:hypothetical protein
MNAFIPNTPGPTAWGKKKIPAPNAVEKKVTGQYRCEIFIMMLDHHGYALPHSQLAQKMSFETGSAEEDQ